MSVETTLEQVTLPADWLSMNVACEHGNLTWEGSHYPGCSACAVSRLRVVCPVGHLEVSPLCAQHLAFQIRMENTHETTCGDCNTKITAPFEVLPL